jgi:hypothetical protein
MENYSRDTRVDLTPIGWLYVAHRRLREKLISQNETTQGNLANRAETAIRFALQTIQSKQN